MKKFLYLLAVVLIVGMTAGCTSCNGDVQFGIEYSLQSDGQVNGDVCLTFDGGSFNINGESNYALHWSNTVLLNDSEGIPLETALGAKNSEMVVAANRVNEWLDNSIKVTSAGGTYDIYVKGYVKEIATGLTFAIDRHFSNINTAEKSNPE